jgi:hypothetical protein
MQTPAGFLAFLGANAVGDGEQFISVWYTGNPADNPINITNFHPCNEIVYNTTD